MIKIEDIPEDVWWVWTIQWCGYPVGLDTWEKAKAIMKANPDYFPWETKYDSIPQHVHDAYFKEKNAWMTKLYKETRPESFIGIIPSIMKMDEAMKEYQPEPPKSLSEMLRDLAKMEDDKRRREEEEYAKNKSIWDKHYKPYGLEYRK